MARIRRIVWIIGISLTVFVNFMGAIAPVHSERWRPVGEDVVSVYSFEGKGSEIPVPVRRGPRIDNLNGNVTIGQTVVVWIRTDYKDNLEVANPRITLYILVATILLHFATGAISRKASRGA
jgi:hypothetical protein